MVLKIFCLSLILSPLLLALPFGGDSGVYFEVYLPSQGDTVRLVWMTVGPESDSLMGKWDFKELGDRRWIGVTSFDGNTIVVVQSEPGCGCPPSAIVDLR